MPFLDNSYNYSLFSIPATYVLGMATHISAVRLAAKSSELPNFDNTAPRECIARIRALADKSADARQYLRAEAAQLNIFEGLGVYAAAVLAGNWARLPISFLNKAALAYVAFRIAFATLYVRTDQEKYTMLRSATWFASSGVVLSLIVKTSNQINKALW
ncbi:hypothetical protein JCM8208_004178 [Rhodotorula glutinis]